MTEAAALPVCAESDMCAACKTRQPLAEMEPVPTSPERLRCQDADACRKRYTPRRLAWSVRAASTR
jgi:hypothetical protein